MSNQFDEKEQNVLEESAPEEKTVPVVGPEAKSVIQNFAKKKTIIICGIIIAVVAIIAIALIILIPSKFERVKNECVQIAGMVTGSGDYFMIDTYPEGMYVFSDTQEKALEAIKYANEELGFNGSVYSQMMNTTALMGRQSAENDKYKVSWTYHPDDGLEVTYEKK